MTDDTSQSKKGNQRQEATGAPLRLVRGDASPEELAALVAILATIHGPDAGDGGPDPGGRPSPANGRSPDSRWSTHRRMRPTTLPHGPGGWRASALPR